MRIQVRMKFSEGTGHQEHRSASGHHNALTFTRVAPIAMAWRPNLLCRSSVRGHRPEIMFSVLVVVLRPDHIAGLGFSSGQREIPLIASLRVLSALRVWAGGTRGPPH